MGIRHELAHLLVGRGGGRFGTAMPVWLNEGLATWLETADPQRPDGPAPVSDWVRLVAAVAPAPTLETLTSATSADFMSTHNEVAYAYSNLLVAFLIEADAEGFWELARAAREGQGGDLDALVARLGPVDKLEAAWARAMSARRARFATTLSEQSERTHR